MLCREYVAGVCVSLSILASWNIEAGIGDGDPESNHSFGMHNNNSFLKYCFSLGGAILSSLPAENQPTLQL